MDVRTSYLSRRVLIPYLRACVQRNGGAMEAFRARDDNGTEDNPEAEDEMIMLWWTRQGCIERATLSSNKELVPTTPPNRLWAMGVMCHDYLLKARRSRFASLVKPGQLALLTFGSRHMKNFGIYFRMRFMVVLHPPCQPHGWHVLQWHMNVLVADAGFCTIRVVNQRVIDLPT